MSATPPRLAWFISMTVDILRCPADLPYLISSVFVVFALFTVLFGSRSQTIRLCSADQSNGFISGSNVVSVLGHLDVVMQCLITCPP